MSSQKSFCVAVCIVRSFLSSSTTNSSKLRCENNWGQNRLIRDAEGTHDPLKKLIVRYESKPADPIFLLPLPSMAQLGFQKFSHGANDGGSQHRPRGNGLQSLGLNELNVHGCHTGSCSRRHFIVPFVRPTSTEALK